MSLTPSIDTRVEKGTVEVLQVPQLVRPGTVEAKDHLPSALYLPGPEVAPDARRLPFEGPDPDTIVAAAQAYMEALNKMLAARQERIKAEEAAYAAGYDKNAPLYAVDVFGNSSIGGRD